MNSKYQNNKNGETGNERNGENRNAYEIENDENGNAEMWEIRYRNDKRKKIKIK